MAQKHKLIRITTVPGALKVLLRGQLRFMCAHYDVLAVSSGGPELADVARDEGVATEVVPMTRAITPRRDLNAVWQLYRVFRRERPLIVHTHTPKAGIVGMMAAKLAGVPNRLHTVAGLPLLEETGSKRKLLDVVERVTYACSTKVYPNSRGLYQIVLRERFCRPEKMKVLGNGSSNGIDSDYFSTAHFSGAEHEELRSSLGIAPGDVVFIFVGRLVRDKGIVELVAAFEKLNRSHPRSKLLLVGDYESDLDPLPRSTRDVIEGNGAIIATGWRSDVRPYFASSDALVFPTYREGFPNVVLQAGAMGLPCIVTDINGCNEIISGGENGLIIPVKSEAAVFVAMRKLLEDEGIRRKMASIAREMVVSQYAQRMMWDAILSEYHSVTAERRHRRKLAHIQGK
jgi:glycosyltransferase involved in cell wall biosynthesis